MTGTEWAVYGVWALLVLAPCWKAMRDARGAATRPGVDANPLPKE